MADTDRGAHIAVMVQQAKLARLDDRGLIDIAGPDWRSFLQGLITQDVETIAPGELRYAALLTPQGRLLYDLFVWAHDDGAILDVAKATREALIGRLSMYRLRAKVKLNPLEGEVSALFPGGGAMGALEPGWRADPREPGLGWRSIGGSTPPDAQRVDPEAYDEHRLSLGVGDFARDGLSDKVYAVEANLDLLNGIDFRKGCFVGQEITSRMKRRGTVKTRLVPVVFEGPPPSPGAEVLAGALRAGEIRSGGFGRALALLRLDRACAESLTVEGRPVALAPPAWIAATLAETAPLASGAERDGGKSVSVELEG